MNYNDQLVLQLSFRGFSKDVPLNFMKVESQVQISLLSGKVQ